MHTSPRSTSHCKLRRLLLPVLIAMSLSACAIKQKPVVLTPKNEASAAFLDCVADEWEAGIHGECTKRVIDAWERNVL